MKLRNNKAGGLFDNGRNLPHYIPERVLDLHHNRASQRQIAQEVGTSRQFGQNVLRDYDLTNSYFPAPKGHTGRTVLTPNAVEYIEIEKLCKPMQEFIQLRL